MRMTGAEELLLVRCRALLYPGERTLWSPVLRRQLFARRSPLHRIESRCGIAAAVVTLAGALWLVVGVAATLLGVLAEAAAPPTVLPTIAWAFAALCAVVAFERGVQAIRYSGWHAEGS